MFTLTNTTHEHLAVAIEALGTPSFSELLYAWLCRCLEIDNGTILAYYQTGKPDVFFSHSRVREVHEHMEGDYLSGIYLLDPFHDLHVNKSAPGLYRLRDCAPDSFRRNEYHAKYYSGTTMTDEACFHVALPTGVSVQVCLGRDKSSGSSFSARDLNTARNLSSIVCSLMTVQWKHLTSSGDYTDETLLHHLQAQLKEHRGISLSKRQCEVALLILRGHSTISIGLCLEISPQTVKVFRKQLYRKCSISSQAELFSLMTSYLRV
ncbi:helix-turn-helix domain-containing protein [Granulosicoccus sp. 3-233]|uniref:helix-turn-helix domain-containing protein n=1 Tax=Granulosicoccus sp. 3-233 TaxID=3417969 RepID=UPI003D345BEA